MQSGAGIFVLQKRYAAGILKRFKMESCNPIKTLVETRLSLDPPNRDELVSPTYFRSSIDSTLFNVYQT